MHHRIDDFFLAPIEPRADVVVKHLGRLAERVVIGQINRRQQRRIERFVVIALETAHVVLARRIEIHVDQAFIDLDHAILQAGGDAEFFTLNGQHKTGLRFLRESSTP